MTELDPQSQDRLRRLLDAAPDAIIEADAEGRILLVNEIAQRLFGYTRDEFLALSIEDLLPENLRERHAGHRKTFARDAATRPMGSGLELQARRRDGTLIPVEISLNPVPSDTGFYVVAVVRDVTARRAAEAQFQEMYERFTRELEEKNRQLEARNAEVERNDRLKSEFLANMSHELRSPLHTIIGFADLLLEDLKGPRNEKQRRFVSNIHQDGHHLLALINDLLDLSKMEAGRMEIHDEIFVLAPVVSEVLEMFRPQAEAKGLHLLQAVNESIKVQADGLRLRQILTNLLSNAVKFTPDGGQISVLANVRGRKVTVSVADSGVGIARDEHAAVFEKFYQSGPTTRGVREGTGLGLPITRKLVEMHGGKIWVCSELNHGSTFVFTLPSGDERPGVSPQLVLIIEDKPRAAELLVDYVTVEGFQALCVSDAEQAAMIANELEPDAIIIDLSLEVTTDWPILRELRAYARLESVPIIVVSVADTNLAAQSLGVAAHLTKPVAKRQLLQALSEAARSNAGARGVLVVDDEPLARELLRETLEEGGYQALLAASVAEAMEALDRCRPKAVILDVMMPGMSGIDLLAAMRERPPWREIPVIVLSGQDINGSDVQLTMPPTVAVLRKGHAWKQPLLGALRKAVRSN